MNILDYQVLKTRFLYAGYYCIPSSFSSKFIVVRISSVKCLHYAVILLVFF